MTRFLLLASLTALLALSAPAQDPPRPPGGFPIQLDADRAISYSDGYRTLLDVRYPTTAPPPTGWPCVMVVHGGSGSRHTGWVMRIADMLARSGYVTLAYDTGNNGATQLNRGVFEALGACRSRPRLIVEINEFDRVEESVAHLERLGLAC